jgi:hypothetical protein
LWISDRKYGDEAQPRGSACAECAFALKSCVKLSSRKASFELYIIQLNFRLQMLNIEGLFIFDERRPSLGAH